MSNSNFPTAPYDLELYHSECLYALFAQIFPVNTDFHWQRLLRAYRGEFDDIKNVRFYHTLAHIWDMVNVLQLQQLSEPDRKLALGSIFYHDAIYLRKSAGSERASVLWMQEELAGDYSVLFLSQLAIGIMATAHNQPILALPRWAQLVHDIDLFRLADATVFVKNRDAVRKEYAFVSDKDFLHGQKMFFQKLLTKPLYITEEFVKYEPTARENFSKFLFN